MARRVVDEWIRNGKNVGVWESGGAVTAPTTLVGNEWIRVATGNERSQGLIRISSSKAGNHQSVLVSAGVHFPRGDVLDGRMTLNVLDVVRYGSASFDQVRINASTTDIYADYYVEVRVQAGGADASFRASVLRTGMIDFNDDWRLVDPPVNVTGTEAPGGVSKAEWCGTPIGVWIAPSLLNGWVDYGGTDWETAAYRMEPGGVVRIKGLVKNGTDNTAVFQLPADCRPKLGIHLPTIAAANEFSKLQVRKDGHVYVDLLGTATNSWASIVCSFYADSALG